ncbi:transglutaminase TgpA family protein [Paenibacillus sp. GXUN7292]|uniref:transglutaminase TgpA family protein n=1 Tax=Paenibacillus sp. GXUN7292 TaxID=3422499 RepID=UPI003D7D341E
MNSKRNAWYEKLVSVLIACIIMSTLSIFEAYWWEETFSIAYFTIGTALVIQLVLPWRWLKTKLFLQWLAAAAVTVVKVPEVLHWSKQESWAVTFEMLMNELVKLYPFIWISLAVLVIYQMLLYWSTTRIRIFGTIGTSLIILTIVDSFTPYWLWDNVAVVVLLSLIWLAAYHLHTLQKEHPHSWKVLLEYPLYVVLPMLLVLSIIMLTGISMPATAPLLKDPYTMWKHAKGERVNINLGEKNNAANNGLKSNLSASSGYSRDDSSLGGGFQYDYSPVMTVTTNRKSYWRGETKSFYDGKGWMIEDSADYKRLLSRTKAVGSNGEIDEQRPRPHAQTNEIVQTVSMARDVDYPVLFAAAPVTKVISIGADDAELYEHLSWSPGLWELRWNDQTPQSFPSTYTVVSEEIILDEEALRTVDAHIQEKDLNDIYLQLPDDLPERVKQLAEEITAEAANDYDKARMLEQYLRLHYTYSSTPDSSKLTGQSTDFVDQFLFELYEGYCDYFSTAMVVMARTLDMPARWVKGFAPGYLPASASANGWMDSEAVVTDPAGAGTYTVRNSDAHSWLEIYFDGYGWIAFEPTAGFSFPYAMPLQEETDIQQPEVPEEKDEPAAPEMSENTTEKTASLIPLLLLIIVPVIGLLFALLYRKKLIDWWTAYRYKSIGNNERIIMEANKLLRQCARQGLLRSEHETMREAVLRWLDEGKYKSAKQPLLQLLDLFEQARYSGKQASAEQLQVVQRCAEEVKHIIAEAKKDKG